MTPPWPEGVKIHPAAELFPFMTEAHFAELVEDIRENGLAEPIVRTPRGELLDGRNRLLACIEANVKPKYTTHGGNPWKFAISANLHRRHLTDAQRAVIAGKLALRSRGERGPSNASAEAFGGRTPTHQEAAELLQVSRTAVQRVRTVLKNGTPEINKLMEDGKVPLATAERVALTLTPSEQDDFVRKVNSGMRSRGAAPPEKEAADPIRRNRSGRPPVDDSVITAEALRAVANDLNGVALAVKPITAIDAELSTRDREALERAFTKGIQALTRIRKLMRNAANGEKQP